MTSLIAWIGVDSHGPSSAYLASDSRITWPGGGTWDHGRKLFACRRHAHMLGYCGDVLFPTQTLSQIAEMIDSELLVSQPEDADGLSERIASVMASAFRSYPATAKRGFEVLYCMRRGAAVPSEFYLRRITFNPGTEPCISTIEIPGRSQVVAILGSGTPSVQKHLGRWQASDVGGTSRAAFAAFCDSLRSGDDPSSQGPPQLVGLWRKGAALTFGTIWQERRYFYGTEVEPPSGGDLRWYNELLEIADPKTLARREDAQPQPRPRGL